MGSRSSIVVVRPVRNGLAIGWLLLCLTPFALQAMKLQFVYTPSVPRGIYQTEDVRTRVLQRGDYVCLEGWRPTAPEVIRNAALDGQVPLSWIHGERLTKRVAGIPGDRVTYVNDGRGGHVEINGESLQMSTALERDSAGARLPRPHYPFVLKKEEYWLTSEHERGFDSRYFGPVSLDALGCRAELLWRW